MVSFLHFLCFVNLIQWICFNFIIRKKLTFWSALRAVFFFFFNSANNSFVSWCFLAVGQLDTWSISYVSTRPSLPVQHPLLYKLPLPRDICFRDILEKKLPMTLCPTKWTIECWQADTPGAGNGNPLQFCGLGQRRPASHSPWGNRVGHDLVTKPPPPSWC